MYDNETFRNKIHDLLGRLLRQCDRTRNATVYDYEVKDLQKYFDTLEKRKDQPIKYVWLDINTGRFSNSWSDGSHEIYAGDLITVENLQKSKERGYKLIRYNVLNDEDFEFYNLMMVTAKKSDQSKLYSLKDMRKMYDISCGQIGLSLSADPNLDDSRFNKFLETIAINNSKS